MRVNSLNSWLYCGSCFTVYPYFYPFCVFFSVLLDELHVNTYQMEGKGTLCLGAGCGVLLLPWVIARSVLK